MDATMAGFGWCVLLLGPLVDHISPSGFGAVDGDPEGPCGKRDCPTCHQLLNFPIIQNKNCHWLLNPSLLYRLNGIFGVDLLFFFGFRTNKLNVLDAKLPNSQI